MNIVEELTEFAIAEPATAWWIPAGEWNRYEYLYNRTPLTEVSQAHTPITMKLASGVHVAIHEAALVDYCRHVAAARDGTAPEGRAVAVVERDRKVVARARRSSRPGARCRSPTTRRGSTCRDLILNLNEPNKLGDVSWVKPFKYVGIWWGMHLGTHTWGSGPKHGATTAETQALHRFRRGQWLPRRAGRRLEQGLGRRLVRARR